jgi:cobalt-zinc-cadmium efflux system membrane fusion protein
MSKFSPTIAAVLLAGILVQGCNRSDGDPQGSRPDLVPRISTGGAEIQFSPDAPQLQQFKIEAVRAEKVRVEFSAPAHLAVSVVSSRTGEGHLFLFENQDLTQLYSDYTKTGSAIERSAKNLTRLRDLSEENAVADKELLDAQTDYSQTRADLARMESQLRAAGIDPRDLSGTPEGTVLAIADIPENQLARVSHATTVNLTTNAYPDEEIPGRIEAVGDVIDPATRTVKVRMAVANSRNRLRAGMYGTAHFADLLEDQVTIPATAAVREGDGTITVWVTPDRRRFLQRKVSLGVQHEDRYQVLDGLKPGDLVVGEGGVFLSNMTQAQPAD